MTDRTRLEHDRADAAPAPPADRQESRGCDGRFADRRASAGRLALLALVAGLLALTIVPLGGTAGPATGVSADAGTTENATDPGHAVSSTVAAHEARVGGSFAAALLEADLEAAGTDSARVRHLATFESRLSTLLELVQDDGQSGVGPVERVEPVLESPYADWQRARALAVRDLAERANESARALPENATSDASFDERTFERHARASEAILHGGDAPRTNGSASWNDTSPDHWNESTSWPEGGAWNDTAGWNDSAAWNHTGEWNGSGWWEDSDDVLLWSTEHGGEGYEGWQAPADWHRTGDGWHGEWSGDASDCSHCEAGDGWHTWEQQWGRHDPDGSTGDYGAWSDDGWNESGWGEHDWNRSEWDDDRWNESHWQHGGDGTWSEYAGDWSHGDDAETWGSDDGRENGTEHHWDGDADGGWQDDDSHDPYGGYDGYHDGDGGYHDSDGEYHDGDGEYHDPYGSYDGGYRDGDGGYHDGDGGYHDPYGGHDGEYHDPYGGYDDGSGDGW